MKNHSIYLFDTVVSTNDTIREGNYPPGAVVLAAEQTGGRGQRGSSWSSEKGRNLTFSLLFEPEGMHAGEQFHIIKIVTLALCDAIKTVAGAEALIKWPNDIYIGDRKTAGILIENDLHGERIGRSVIGIGLNVNQRQFDPALPNPTSLAAETGAEIDRMELLAAFLEAFDRYALISGIDRSEADRKYLEKLYLFGQEASYFEPAAGRRFNGVITEVAPTGELLIKDDAGNMRSYLFKEIEYLPRKL